jgi:hypothetical protein
VDFHFLILGGYGNAGRRIAELLLKESNSSLIIAGRNLARAYHLTDDLNRKFKGGRIQALELDVRDPDHLMEVLSGITMVIVASSTSGFTQNIAMAAIKNKVDYLDIQFSQDKIRFLRSLEKEINQAGLCFITDGGYHPGIPAVMIRYAATGMDSIRKATVGAIMNINWNAYQFSSETIREFTDELKAGVPLIFKNGQWQKAKWGGMLDTLRMDFGVEYGKHDLFPMFLEEMRNLPAHLRTLKKTGFYIGGMDWFSNWISFPMASIWFQIFPESRARWIERMIFWGMKKFSTPPYYSRIKMIGEGIIKGKPARYSLTLSHSDAYLFTAIPVVACLRQYIQDDQKKVGLFTQGEFVDPIRFLKDIQRMGVKIEEDPPTSWHQSN